MTGLQALIPELHQCTICDDLPLGPKPIFQLHTSARILIAGQAPGRITHHKGRPFDDPSGKNLRAWMGIDSNAFYDETKLAMLPMGLCFPGTGKAGDLPPRSICAATWRSKVLQQLPNIRLKLVIGQYAQSWHLPQHAQLTLTERVKNWDRGNVVPLPHPSPRNGIWLKNNPWFGNDMLPMLRKKVQEALHND
jgi:uracil-DNA glycosylase